MRPLNIIIQSTAVDLLQSIVARGELEILSVETIEAVVIGKLYFCVHTRHLDLQNKLLHLLHSVISASTSHQEPQQSPPGKQRHIDGPPEDVTHDNLQETGTRSYAVNALLIHTLVDGITSPSNRAVLQHWLDFILMAIPQFQPTLQVVVVPLNDCLCRQLRSSLTDLLQASTSNDDETGDVSLHTTDADFIMLLNGLERLTLLSLTNTSYTGQPEEEPTMEKLGQENSGLLGYVSNVFSSDHVPSTADDQLTVSRIAWLLCSFEECRLAVTVAWLSFTT
jgi:hypothetical protein